MGRLQQSEVRRGTHVHNMSAKGLLTLASQSVSVVAWCVQPMHSQAAPCAIHVVAQSAGPFPYVINTRVVQSSKGKLWARGNAGWLPEMVLVIGGMGVGCSG